MGKFSEALKKSNKQSVPSSSTIIFEPEVDKIPGNGAHNKEREYHPETILLVEPEAKKSTLKTPAIHTNGFFDKNLVAYHDPHSFEAEQFRMLRTNILFPSKDQILPKTILVTSAVPKEGKSFVSSNLAITIAQNIDQHVMLIDCDMRRPMVHKNFGCGNVQGLSNYLLGEMPLHELLIKIENLHLSILPGGPQPPNPAELLSSNKMMALLREVRDRYSDRYIIIDSPPPHLTAESNALAKFVDGIIIVIKLKQTSQQLISDLVDKFPKDKILGIVSNWLDRHTTNLYGSGKYTHYGYYNSKKST